VSRVALIAAGGVVGAVVQACGYPCAAGVVMMLVNVAVLAWAFAERPRRSGSAWVEWTPHARTSTPLSPRRSYRLSEGGE